MIEINNTTRVRIDQRKIKRIAQEYLERRKIKKDLSIAFIGDYKMRRLNKSYRGKDKSTDILSFEGDRESFGELIINPRQTARQARRLGHRAEYELVFILVHGLLHLSGYEDDTEKDRVRMIALGEKFLTDIRYEKK